MPRLTYRSIPDLSTSGAASLPLERISLEMVFRGLYHFSVAFQRGVATDPVAYLASQADLGIVKRRRKYRERQALDKRRPMLNV